MGQILAECDCPRETACLAAGACLAGADALPIPARAMTPEQLHDTARRINDLRRAGHITADEAERRQIELLDAAMRRSWLPLWQAIVAGVFIGAAIMVARHG
jgi:hypothetical protein